MGQPFIDDAIVARSKQALRDAGLELVEHDTVVATKAGGPRGAEEDEGRRPRSTAWCSSPAPGSGRPTWSPRSATSPLTGKGVLIWTHPGSQGWRPVGGLVMHGALLEVGIPHKFVYGAADDPADVGSIVSFCRAAHMQQLAQHGRRSARSAAAAWARPAAWPTPASG